MGLQAAKGNGIQYAWNYDTMRRCLPERSAGINPDAVPED